MNGRRFALVLALSGGPLPLEAPQPLTLDDAQAEARSRAPEAGELDAVVRGAEAIAAQASRVFRLDPTVSFTYFNGAWIGLPDETSWSVDAKLPLDLFGSWEPRGKSAAADVRRTQLDRENGLRALDEQVAIAVADVALQQRLVERGERLLDLYALASDAARQQLRVGQGSELDKDSADLDLAGARVSLEEARAEWVRARTRLARLLGRESGIDLLVADPPEPVPPLERPDFDARIDRDPRVRAALAEIEAAKFQEETLERLLFPIPTLGISSGHNRRDIPAGSFSGTPFADSLTANWADRDLVFSVSLPVPLLDRQLEPRARAAGRRLTAEARLRTARANVRMELEATWGVLESTARALRAVADMPAVIKRDLGFIEQAVRAGAFDAATRSVMLRRLEDAGRRVDAAVRDFRVARASWSRRAI